MLDAARIRTLGALLCALALLVAACGGSGSSGGYGAGGRSLTPTRTTGNERGTVELTGAVTGDMALENVICAPQGATIIINLAGKVGDTPYGIQINSVSTGGFFFGTPKPPDQAALVLLSDQTTGKNEVSRWSAGFRDTPGKGAVAIGTDRSGTIDADLEGSQGTKGNVHVRGVWKCPGGGTPQPSALPTSSPTPNP